MRVTDEKTLNVVEMNCCDGPVNQSRADQFTWWQGGRATGKDGNFIHARKMLNDKDKAKSGWISAVGRVTSIDRS